MFFCTFNFLTPFNVYNNGEEKEAEESEKTAFSVCGAIM